MELRSADQEKVWSILKEIPDPEIPVISIVELGIVRGIETDGHNVTVQITPTYSGCPALDHMRAAVKKSLEDSGYLSVDVQTVYSPAWSTDWLSAEAKAKLKKFGIAPPGRCADNSADSDQLVQLTGLEKLVVCPYCESQNTELRTEFSSTACKALYYCNGCSQPFEYFKPF